MLKANADTGQIPENYADVGNCDFLSTVSSTQMPDNKWAQCFQDLAHRKKTYVGPLVFSLDQQLILFKSGVYNESVL